MTDNRTTERLMAMLKERGVKHELEHDLYVEWVDARGNDVTAFKTSCKHKGDVLIVHVFLTPEQAIAATLGGNENRISERLRGVAYDMRNIGASSMTPRELFAYWAGEVDKAADLADFMCGVNQDGLNETCKNLSEMNVDGVAGYHFICSECGLSVCASMGVGEIELSGPRSFRWKVDGRYEFEKCPRCGKAVER